MNLQQREDGLSTENRPPSPRPDMADAPEQSRPSHVLTPRQRQIMQFIRETVDRRGYPPSLREVADAVGLASKSSVVYQLSSLEQKGYLRREAGRPRTIEMRLPCYPAVRPEPSRQDDGLPGTAGFDFRLQEMTSVPLVGQVAAGYPITANEEPEGAIELPRQLVGDGALFGLKVTGDSMINAGIFDGDLVVVRQQATVSNGDIVVALLDGEATVKTCRHSDGHVWLIPQNSAYAPILGDDATILGRVVSVLRRI